MIKQSIKIAVLAAALAGATGASAYPWTLNYAGGAAPNFVGFDWDQNGTVVTQGFDPTIIVGNQTFEMVYFSTAASILKPGGGKIIGPAVTNPNVGVTLGDFEYTIVAALNVTASCAASTGGICTELTFDSLNSGLYSIFYDTTADANLATGTGFLNGAQILGGTLTNGDASSGSQISAFTMEGHNDFVDTTYVTPDDINLSQVSGTLQFQRSVTGWTKATGLPQGSLTARDLQFQADANQIFLPNDVPEPASLALVGLGLGGMGFFGRRRGTKKSAQ